MSEENRPKEENRQEKSTVDKAIDKVRGKIDEAQRKGTFDKAAKKIQEKLKGR